MRRASYFNLWNIIIIDIFLSSVGFSFFLDPAEAMLPECSVAIANKAEAPKTLMEGSMPAMFCMSTRQGRVQTNCLVNVPRVCSLRKAQTQLIKPFAELTAATETEVIKHRANLFVS